MFNEWEPEEDIMEDLTDFLTLEEAGLEDSYVGDTVPAAQMIYYKEEGN